MSNAFHSRAQRSHRALNVTPDPEGFRIELADAAFGAVPFRDILLSESDAATVALAIIKAPGAIGVPTHSYTTGTPEHLAVIASGLARYISARDRAAERKAERLAQLEAEVAAAEAAKAAEAADLAELEREALAMRNAFNAASGYPPMDEINTHQFDYAEWLAVARHVRACLNQA